MDAAFTTCTLDSLNTGSEGFDYRDFALYTGATRTDPVEGMFSFAPCRPAGDGGRFARPPIRLPGLVNPASRQSTFGSHRPLTVGRIRTAWEDIRGQVLAHDLLLGTRFETPPKERPPSGSADAPLVPRGHACQSRDEFTELLRRWFDETDEPTIGEPGRFGGKAWAWATVGGHRCHLNADSTRAGIGRYLELARELGPDLPWRVVANTRGKLNKIVIEPTGEPTPGPVPVHSRHARYSDNTMTVRHPRYGPGRTPPALRHRPAPDSHRSLLDYCTSL
jgi:hypothetical protein